jgi:hypothetical protein
MAKTIRAYKISEENLKKNKMPNYNELMDGVAHISPIKMRNISSWHFHVLEDVKGNIYLTEDDAVMQNKLYERNLGITETKYMIDGLGLQQIKQYKAEQEAKKEEPVEEVQEENNNQEPSQGEKDDEKIEQVEQSDQNREE